MSPKFSFGTVVKVTMNEYQYKIARINLIFVDEKDKLIRYGIEGDGRLYQENRLESFGGKI